MKNNKKIYILFSILISFFAFSLVEKTFQNDTYSAIRIGKYILSNGIDFVEHFNIDSSLYYHNARWLFNVIMAFLYNNFSFVGIYIFIIIINITIGLSMFNTLIKQKNNIIISFVVTLFTLYVTQEFVAARAQIVSYLLFFLEVFFIERLISTKSIKYIFFIVIGSILVANIHTTVWPMTIIFFLPYFAEYFLSKFKKIQNSKKLYSETKDIKLLLITFIITIISGFCTPIGLTPFSYMFKTMGGISKEYIAELQPTDLFFEPYFLMYTIIFIILLVYFKIRIKISDLFMICGLYIMGVLAIRNHSFLYYISAIIICRLIKEGMKNKQEKFEKGFNIILNERPIILSITFCLLLVSILNYIPIINNKFVDNTAYPVDAADYILKNIDIEKMRLYNGFGNGAYLEFRGMKVFLDSRSEVYCKEYNNTSILQDSHDVSKLQVYYKDIFDKYKFTHVLLYKYEILNKYVKHDKDYRKIYSDDYFVLYEKK